MITRRSVLAGTSAALLAGAAPRKAWGKTDADVIVIGAGLAGLFAAHRAEVGGLKVIVLEAENRVGGRLHTLDDLPGRPEAGGIQVGRNYHNVFHIADDLKIPLIEEQAGPPGFLYRVGGTSFDAKDWATSPANRLNGSERNITPAALASFYNAKLPKLDTPESWATAEAITRLDQPYSAKLSELGASEAARQLIAANLNGNSLNSLSALHVARSLAIAREEPNNRNSITLSAPGNYIVIGGGAQRLPEALAKFLTTEVRLNQRVAGIAEGQSGVRVALSSGKVLHARDVICTIPFSAMRNVKLSGINDPIVARLIGTMPYTMGSFVYLQASDPFWLSDGHPRHLWTDDPLLGRVFVLGNDPPMLKVFATGPTAARIDAMDPDAAAASIIARIEAARPSAKGKLKALRVYSWQKQASFGGIYHHLSPGIAADVAALAQRTSGRVHFAGEHLALRHSGMEGALESGERIGRMLEDRAEAAKMR